jgi:hypothetical protein
MVAAPLDAHAEGAQQRDLIGDIADFGDVVEHYFLIGQQCRGE